MIHYNRFRYYDLEVGVCVINNGVYPANPLSFVDRMGLDPATGPTAPIDAGKIMGRWDKMKVAFDCKESVAAGKEKRINNETLTCKRAAEREKRCDEDRQNRLEDRAAGVRDVFSSELSHGVEAGRSYYGAIEAYGCYSAEVPSCKVLLQPPATVPTVNFFKQ